MYRTVVIATAGPAIVGCSLLLDSNRTQCASTSDCTNRGPAFTGTVCVDSFCQADTPSDPTWGCAGSPAILNPDAGTTFVASIVVFDGESQEPLPGVQATLCAKLDVDCTSPLASPITSDSNGLVSFNVPGGFNGYLELTSSTIVPTLYFFNPPIVSNTTSPQDVSLLQPADVMGLGEGAGVTLLSDRGIIILTALDCQGNPAPGVDFSVSNGDPMTAVFYAVGMLPQNDAGAPCTGISGYAGLANVPPGLAAVTGTLLATGEKLGTVSLFVRAGSVTYSQWVPLAE